MILLAAQRCLRHRGTVPLTTSTWPTPYSRFQAFFSVSTQISPDLDTFGWKILVIMVPVVSYIRSGVHNAITPVLTRTFRRQVRVLRPKVEADAEVPSLVRRPSLWLAILSAHSRGQRTLTRALHPAFELAQIVLINNDAHTLRRLLAERNDLAGQETERSRCEGLWRDDHDGQGIDIGCKIGRRNRQDAESGAAQSDGSRGSKDGGWFVLGSERRCGTRSRISTLHSSPTASDV